ncbi:Mis6-domain-containing protein [Xylaria bambusicola]|uniref:Mis6-domain-containing protein n=1 Tax=Xylaria bambusicola TaxID=326684 RepID=UPI0020079FF6|nr:Mis6-domain-containing protein [Xylaria bambusicola]KAI0503366.1 Mis6-domain-containing protein [Xylaria bambusicola]
MSRFRNPGQEEPGEEQGQTPTRAQASSPLETSEEMQVPLSEVLRASKLPAKQRGMNVKPAVDQLTSLAYDQGLLPTDLNQLINLITTPNFLDQASLSSVIRNLYPATSVAGELVIKVIGCLGHGKLKPSLTIQAALLKWLIMIQNVVESRNYFLQAYPVLFNLLDTAALRTHVCHLLALITRRRHVRPHRIQSLLLLSRQTGNDPALTGLLRVYKDYYPEIIVGDVTRGKASAFNHPDSQWRERLDEIRRAHAQRRASRSETPLDAFRVARHRLNGTKNFLIPEVHTLHATERSITLEEIESVDGFVKNLERIELPNQLISVLGDPLLQKLLYLRPQAQAHLRACNWLSSYTQDMMAGESDTHIIDILNTLKNYVTATKALPPIFLAFLAELMNNWDGVEGRELVLDILTYTPLGDFQELQANLFQSLEKKVLDGTPQSQLQILDFFTSLLRQWITRLVSSDKKSLQASQCAAGLVAHVNNLCLTLIQTSSNMSTHGKVLDFYYETSSLSSDVHLLTHVQVPAVPPATLIYSMFFAASPSTASRVCSVIAKYKEGFQTAMRVAQVNYTPRHIPEFNGFLMDICNCLWRQRALSGEDANAKGCLIPHPLVEDLSTYVASLSIGAPLASLFSLSYSPLFSSFSISFLRELEDEIEDQETLDVKHAGPVTKTSLRTLANRGGINVSWDDYRRGVLGYLGSRDMRGVEHLLSVTMGTLRQK